MSTRSTEAVVDELLGLFAAHGDQRYDEVVTQTEHALQCAALAEADGADAELVAAALLHDVGHLLLADERDPGEGRERDLQHEAVAGRWLRRHFTDAVVDPVVLHVQAKRYLCAVDPRYHDGLSPGSVRSLELQGGPLDAAGVAAFEVLPRADDAARLRRWDDRAKVAAAPTPSLDQYRELLGGLAHP